MKTHACRYLAVVMGFIITMAAHSEERQPTGIDSIVYFDADIRDAEFCQFSIKNGEPDFGPNVTNPAMTCPDAFSWHLFAEVIKDEFWLNWADERQNWPKTPWPLCSNTKDQKQCCDPASNDNNKEHCPLFPGDDHAIFIEQAKTLLADQNPPKSARKQQKQSIQFLDNNPRLARVGRPRGKGKLVPLTLAETKNIAECTTAQIDSVLPDNPQSIGRILRQTNSEITVRNKAFHDYLFENNLYNSDGVVGVYNRNNDNQQSNAPFHQKNISGNTKQQGELTTIDLPPNSIMLKANWVSDKLVAAMQKKYHKKQVAFGDADEYIRKPLITQITDSKGKKCNITGSHWLMAFHISSKDIPQWVWTTFEHKNNPGRCDYTGCNDSFGYLVDVPDTTPVQQTNFITPNQHSDDLAAPSIVYNPDLQYPAGNQTKALAMMLKHAGIATSDKNGIHPNPQDKAWLSYRLKGSQVDFTDHQGRATHLGNSITEAGFMGRSSCISCHARATVTQEFNPTGSNFPFLGLGVFQPELSDFGYQQSNHGVPNHAWFYNSDSDFSLKSLQTDFIWGFLNACPLEKGC